jgi:hypothetical protein
LKTDHLQAGKADELSLRVSVAVLVRMLFNNPGDGKSMLALERTATLHQIAGNSEVVVRAKPFGGAVLLLNPHALQQMIGRFNYDSEKSRRERDFRLLIQPSSWNKIKEICRDQYHGPEKGILDHSPVRELEEEIEDSLHIKIKADKFASQLVDMIIEDVPQKTKNIRARGFSTVRIYYIYEVLLKDTKLIKKILVNSELYSDKELKESAWQDSRQGGRGRANAMLVLSLDELRDVYRKVSSDKSRRSVHFKEHLLDGNVWVVLGKNIIKDIVKKVS